MSESDPNSRDSTSPPTNSDRVELPEWCNVYDGLTDQQLEEMEAVILERADLSRPS